MNLNDYEDLIVEWGYDKGILPEPDMIAQFTKTAEEVKELAMGIDAGDRAEVQDAIGDIFVTLVMQTQCWGLTMQECVASVYEVISQRTGKMVDGVFVKDED